jgi:hypothetical protein
VAAVRIASAVALAIACCGVALAAGAPVHARPPAVDRFSSTRTWDLVRKQLRYGQRPAGSPQLRRLASELRRLLPDGQFEAIPGQSGLRNVIGTLPGRRPGIVIGAHYDTLADPKGFVGANNGAAGTAVVIEVARALAARPARRGAREIRFVLFDGEEPPSGLPEDSSDFYNSGLRGSRAYVAAHPGRTAQMVLLDYVGNKSLNLPREANSTRSLWTQLRSAARAVGAGSIFPAKTGPGFQDDHTPFLRAGVQAIDLIDPSYDGHDLSDRLDRLSRRSLDAVGETTVELALRLR